MFLVAFIVGCAREKECQMLGSFMYTVFYSITLSCFIKKVFLAEELPTAHPRLVLGRIKEA